MSLIFGGSFITGGIGVSILYAGITGSASISFVATSNLANMVQMPSTNIRYFTFEPYEKPEVIKPKMSKIFATVYIGLKAKANLILMGEIEAVSQRTTICSGRLQAMIDYQYIALKEDEELLLVA